MGLLTEDLCCFLDCLGVLLLERGRFHVPTLRRRGKDPLAAGGLGQAHVQNRLDPRSHRNAAARVVSLPVLNLDLPVPNALRTKAEALLWAEPTIQENG